MSWIAHTVGRPGLLTGISRILAPLFPAVVWRKKDAGRTLFVTFDDGPHPVETPMLLDLLDRHAVPASFFHLGAAAETHPDLVRAVADAGHTIGQHTHTHPDPWRTSPRVLREEMARATKAIEDAAGQPVRWMRPPYGHLTRPIRRWAEAHGQRIAMWDVMPGDFLSSATADVVATTVVRLVRPGSVIVLHEGGRATEVTPAALEQAIPILRDDGYDFAAL
jgi:peptidoglycan-N-acetylglucosamine deacetylase